MVNSSVVDSASVIKFTSGDQRIKYKVHAQADLVSEMKDRGLTILEAIKMSRELFGINLAEAKLLVCSHPDWKDTAVTAAPLHEEIINAFEDAVADDRLP